MWGLRLLGPRLNTPLTPREVPSVPKVQLASGKNDEKTFQGM